MGLIGLMGQISQICLMDGRVDGQMDGQTDGQMDCQMDGQNGWSNLQILTAIHKGVNYDFGRFNQIFMVIDRGVFPL